MLAKDLQTQKKRVDRSQFEACFIEKEIQEQKQWKIVMDQSHCMPLVHQFRRYSNFGTTG